MQAPPPLSTDPPAQAPQGWRARVLGLLGLLGSRLYLRIWLAVLAAVAVLTLLAGWAWRMAEDARRDAEAPPVREMRMLGPDGQIVAEGEMRQIHKRRGIPTFEMVAPDGSRYIVQMPRRHHRPPLPPWSRWPYTGYGYIWLLAIVALAVALGVYPLVRRLTRQLESLQRSVADWGSGKLGTRATVRGRDEVADLARHFNQAADHIEALINAQKSLLANASHELRSPLARIRLAVELMAQNPTSATRNEIKRNIAELDQLVDEILLASRLDARQADLGSEEAVDMLGLAAEEAASTGAQLQLEGDPAACQVHGVPKLLRRMVRNLLENAKRHGNADPGKPVHLSLKPGGQTLIITVADHGPGVPQAMRERIFEPFFRSPGASETSGGVGLGLALVRSIAERHGGQVQCQARQDGAPGAVFVLTLPTLPAD